MQSIQTVESRNPSRIPPATLKEMFNLDAMKMRLLELEIVVQEARGVENITKRKVTDLRYTIDQLKEANIACDCTRIKVELDEAHSLYVSQVTTSSDAEGP